MRLNSPQINLIIKACMKASRSLIRDFGELENLQVSAKSPGDFVSSADKRTEKIIIGELQKAHPDYGIITEESGVINESKTLEGYTRQRGAMCHLVSLLHAAKKRAKGGRRAGDPRWAP